MRSSDSWWFSGPDFWFFVRKKAGPGFVGKTGWKLNPKSPFFCWGCWICSLETRYPEIHSGVSNKGCYMSHFSEESSGKNDGFICPFLVMFKGNIQQTLSNVAMYTSIKWRPFLILVGFFLMLNPTGRNASDVPWCCYIFSGGFRMTPKPAWKRTVDGPESIGSTPKQKPTQIFGSWMIIAHLDTCLWHTCNKNKTTWTVPWYLYKGCFAILVVGTRLKFLGNSYLCLFVLWILQNSPTRLDMDKKPR